MAESSAIASQGLKLQIDTGGATWVDIAEVNEFDLPAMSHEYPEVTHHQSDGNFKEFVGKLKELEEYSITCNLIWEDSTHDEVDGLIDSFESDIKESFRLVWPTSSEHYIEHSAYVDVEFDGGGTEDRAGVVFNLRPTSETTYGTLS